MASSSHVRPAHLLLRRVTAVLDEDTDCPGTYAEYVMPSLIVCGDGYMDQREECEDGNTEDGDGCSSTCYVEPGWTCDGRVESPVSLHEGSLISLCTKASPALASAGFPPAPPGSIR